MDTTKSLTANLRELKDNPKYLGMFDYLFARKRDATRSTIETIYNEVKKGNATLKFQDVLDFFKKFEELGIGKNFQEEGNKYHTFVWEKAVTGVALAVNNSGPYCGVQVTESEESYVPSISSVEKKSAAIVETYEFPLRKNFKVHLPKDLTRKEIEYFKQYLDNLTEE